MPRCDRCPVPGAEDCDAYLCPLAGTSDLWDRHILGRARLGVARPAAGAAGPMPARLDRVRTCAHRGSVLPMSLQDTSGCCGGGRELTECRAGQGATPGRVTLGDCLACAAGRPRVVLHTYACSFTGYGRIARGLGRGLEDLGLAAAYHAVIADESLAPLDGWVRDRLVPAAEGEAAPWHVQLQVPETAALPGVRKVAFTMTESTGLHPAQLAGLAGAEVVVVPSRANRGWFAAAGVAAPIRVVPMGLTDPELFRPADGPRPDRPFTVGMAGRQVHGVQRKGFALGVEAFRAAFPADPGVRLIVRSFDSVPVDTRGDPRVVVDRTALDSAAMGAAYRGLDCFLSGSRGEGWGMHQHEAAACAVPVVGAIWGGLAEFLDPAECYPAAFAEGPAGAGWAGSWCHPDVGALAAQLRAVRADPAEARRRALLASARAHSFTWQQAAGSFREVLREFGFLEAR